MGEINMKSRVREPYARFCEKTEPYGLLLLGLIDFRQFSIPPKNRFLNHERYSRIKYFYPNQAIVPQETREQVVDDCFGPISTKLVADIYLQGPTDHGQIHLFNENWIEAFASGNRVYPEASIRPQTGDLIIYHAGKLVGMDSSVDKVRIVATCRFEAQGDHLPLKIWGDRA